MPNGDYLGTYLPIFLLRGYVVICSFALSTLGPKLESSCNDEYSFTMNEILDPAIIAGRLHSESVESGPDAFLIVESNNSATLWLRDHRRQPSWKWELVCWVQG